MTTRPLTEAERARLASGRGVTGLDVTCCEDTGHGPCGRYRDWTGGRCAKGHEIEIVLGDDAEAVIATVGLRTAEIEKVR